MVEETTLDLMDRSEAALPGRQRAPVRSGSLLRFQDAMP
jgi:hypothetical protein